LKTIFNLTLRHWTVLPLSIATYIGNSVQHDEGQLRPGFDCCSGIMYRSYGENLPDPRWTELMNIIATNCKDCVVVIVVVCGLNAFLVFPVRCRVIWFFGKERTYCTSFPSSFVFKVIRIIIKSYFSFSVLKRFGNSRVLMRYTYLCVWLHDLNT